jgi:MFS family permease
MLYPIIPLFLSETLGVSKQAIGIVEGAADGMSSLLRGLSGYLSDRFKRRKIFVVIGYAASAIAKPLTALATSWHFVLGTRLFDRFGKSVRTAPRDALISAQVSVENRGYAFGFHRAMDTTGAVLGPALALLLVWFFGLAYRTMFVLAIVPAAIAVIIAMAVVREVRDSPVPDKSISKTKRPSAPVRAWLTPALVRFYIVTGVFALANSSNTFIILRAQDIFGRFLHGTAGHGTTHTAADALAIAGYIVFNFSFAVLAVPIGRLSDRAGRKSVIVGGYLVYAAVYASLAFLASAYTIWILFFVYGIYEAMTHGVTKALVADLAPSEYRGTALGTANMIEGIGTLAAGLLTGFLWDRYGNTNGPVVAFTVDAVLAVLAALLFLSFRLTPRDGKADK